MRHKPDHQLTPRDAIVFVLLYFFSFGAAGIAVVHFLKALDGLLF